jgi:hypothetical protein
MDNLAVMVTDVPSPFITRLQTTTTNVTIWWSAASNLTYRVQSKVNLSDANWNNLQPTVTAGGPEASFSEQLNVQRSYRLMVLP